MKQYKIKLILITLIILLTITIVSFSNSSKSKFQRKIPKIDFNEKYKVVNVLDGDTFEIKINNKIEKVRMLGIDTPETIDPRKPVQCYGKEASDNTKSMLLNTTVTLQIDDSQSILDKYGRILAYVYSENGLFINKYLLENAFAREYTYGKAYKFQKEFKEIEKEIKGKGIGLWGSLCLQK